MKKNIKELWIKALESGEFKQIKGKLSDEDGYCALGVLTILALIEGQCTFSDLNGEHRFDGRNKFLSYNVRKWMGLEDYLDENYKDLPITANGIRTSIAELNDSGRTFKEIAHILKKSKEY